MATKTTIQNLINSLIRSNPSLIDKTEHADVEDSLLLNSYGDVINETQISNTITSANTLIPSLQYNVFFCKQGRKVTIKGNLVNNSPSILGGGVSAYFFEIIDSEYASNIGVEGIGGAPTYCATISGNPVIVYLNNNRLYFETISAFEVVYLNFEYFTEN